MAFRVKDFLAELTAHRPDIAASVADAVAKGAEDGRRFHPDAATFAQVLSVLVDYAVMENTTRAAMVPADMDWLDIGTGRALHEALETDADGNAVRSSGTVEMVDCRGVLVDSDGPGISVIGLKDVMITTVAGVQKVGKLAGALDQ